MKEMTVSELKRRVEGKSAPFVLDVRQPEEFNEASIDGAVLIPLGQLETRLGELDKNAEIVVHCKSGGRSTRAVQFLESRGFANVANLTGGITSWLAQS